ncbi:MAG: hypothetical protein QOH97_3912 [Actinoplanes sp.]|jgi:hypothetical protein|nr:hypothetical protein [Actinoplanes sp.]
MPTKVALAGLTVATLALAGCQGTTTSATQPPAAPAASSVPAGNGLAALSADEILKRATATLRQEPFRAAGSMAQDAQQTDVDLKVDGKDFVGSMTMGKAKVDLLAVGGKKFLRANEAFWVLSTNAKQGKVMAQIVSNRWISGAEKDKSFAELFSVGSVDELLKPTGSLSKGEEKEIDGVPAIALKDSGDPDSALYIATTGEPRPLQIVGKGGSAMAFTAFGKKFDELVKPAADQIIDLGKLTGK